VDQRRAFHGLQVRDRRSPAIKVTASSISRLTVGAVICDGLSSGGQ
jgi:hypothetical protein